MDEEKIEKIIKQLLMIPPFTFKLTEERKKVFNEIVKEEIAVNGEDIITYTRSDDKDYFYGMQLKKIPLTGSRLERFKKEILEV